MEYRGMENKIVQLKTYNNTTAKAKGLGFCRYFGWSWRSYRRIFRRLVGIKLKIITCESVKHIMVSFEAQKERTMAKKERNEEKRNKNKLKMKIK